MNLTRKTILIICVISVGCLLLLVVGNDRTFEYSRDPEYKLGYKYNDIETQNDVVAKLKEHNIDFIIGDDGFINYPEREREKVEEILKQLDSQPFKILRTEEELQVYTKVMDKFEIGYKVRPVRRSGIIKVVFAPEDYEKVKENVSPEFDRLMLASHIEKPKQ